MNPKIVFSDIDGTLINTERVFSTTTIQAIKRIKDTIPVILISSRMPSAIKHLQSSAGIKNYPLISYNGGVIMINDKVVSDNAIPYHIISKIVDFNTNEKVHISLYNTNDWYVPREDYWTKREINNTKIIPQVLPNIEVLKLWETDQRGAHKIMCMGDPDDIDRIFNFMKDNFDDDLHLYRSKNTYIEIAAKHISKKTAVEYILKHNYPEIPIENAVAFGDNFNDIEMLDAVGIGVAVANANPEVHKVANYTTLAGTEDGVAHFLNKNISI